jgi:hypothetical protein
MSKYRKEDRYIVKTQQNQVEKIPSAVTVSPKILDEEVVREEFRKFFIKAKRKLGLENKMEEIIWLHLKAIKHDKPEKFEDGIANFGYKL